jgi:hypothetical protein
MSNLGPQQQNVSYEGIMQVPGGITSSLQVVQDGEGNNTGLWVSSTQVSVGLMFLPNQSSPATPTGGGYLYAKAGALYYKGSSGTETKVANA